MMPRTHPPRTQQKQRAKAKSTKSSSALAKAKALAKANKEKITEAKLKTKQLSEELKATGEALSKTKEQFRKWRHSNKDNALTKDFNRLGGKSKAIPAKEFEKLMAQFLSEVLNKAKAKEVLKQESMDSKTEAFIQKEREQKLRRDLPRFRSENGRTMHVGCACEVRQDRLAHQEKAKPQSV